MPVRPNDTHPAAAAAQLALLRAAGVTRRAQIMRSLSRTVVELSRRAVQERMPEASDDQLAVRWIELVYGVDLAARYAAYLSRR